MSAPAPSSEAFGRTVLGPVFGEFALRLHLLLLGLEDPQDTRLLFCARGGLRLRLIYEAFLEAAGLPCPVVAHDLMVSRLVAARTALAAGSAAAFEELGREFRGDSLGRTVRALAQRELLHGPAAEAPFTPEALAGLLAADDDAGRVLRAEIALQNQLFDEHLQALAGPARRLLLCDTGLYGSTVRLLRAGRPEYDWTCALFARCNYKGFPEDHFPWTVGLCVEAGGYRATEPRTAVLRYWHLIESCLEPPLPSVTRFAAVDGEARANLVAPGWEAELEGRPGELFAGVMAYLRTLPRRRAAEQVYADAPLAWRRLHDAIVWPGREARRLLSAGARSRDFGREESVAVIARRNGLRADLREIHGSLWREGAVVDRFPASRWLWLGGLQALHLGRSARALAQGRP